MYSVSGYVGGYGYIDSDVEDYLVFTISGYVAGVGAVSHDYLFREAIVVSGGIAGVGKIGHKLNYSKQKTLNPILIAQNQPYNPGDCPIAALEYEGFSPNKIINIIPREDEVYENTMDYHRVEVLTKVDTHYPITHYPYHDTYNDKLKYLITDFRSHNSNGDPLFFQYEPLFDAYAPDSGVAISNIYRNDETIVDPKDYIIQYSYDLLNDGNTRYSDTTWSSQLKTRKVHRVRVLLPYKFIDENQYYTIEYSKSNLDVSQPQRELIELRNLYNSADYTIDESGVMLTANTRVTESGAIMLVKDPRFRITPLDVVAIKGENSYLSDKVATWKLRMNVGAFMKSSGFFTNQSGNLYNLEDRYFDGEFVPVTNAKPTLVKPDLLRLKESPIYIDPVKYSHPLYTIDTYDKTQDALVDQRGKIAIDVNGITRNDITIKSIDTEKGYLQLDTNLDPTDEIELTYFMSQSGNFLIENLELNPKVTGSGVADFHVSGYPDGFGIAVRPYTNNASGWYPYIYDLNEAESSRTMYNIYPKDTPTDATSLAWTADDFVTVCEIDLNRLSSDIITLTDARRPGGGVQMNRELRDWFKTNYSGRIEEHEKDWYTDYGYYGGAPLSNSSTVVIHVPDPIISGMRQEWIDNFEQSITNPVEARERAEAEFKHTLDQAIRRHLSAGTDYILAPTISGVFTGKFLDLRQ